MNLVSSFNYEQDSESFLQSKQLQLHLQRHGKVFFCLCFREGKDGSVHPTFKSLDFRSDRKTWQKLGPDPCLGMYWQAVFPHTLGEYNSKQLVG